VPVVVEAGLKEIKEENSELEKDTPRNDTVSKDL
jgi:hypothetical protein